MRWHRLPKSLALKLPVASTRQREHFVVDQLPRVGRRLDDEDRGLGRGRDVLEVTADCESRYRPTCAPEAGTVSATIRSNGRRAKKRARIRTTGRRLTSAHDVEGRLRERRVSVGDGADGPRADAVRADLHVSARPDGRLRGRERHARLAGERAVSFPDEREAVGLSRPVRHLQADVHGPAGPRGEPGGRVRTGEVLVGGAGEHLLDAKAA